jgi:hypothetical protein
LRYIKCGQFIDFPKRGLNGNFHTTRPVGGPRTRWADVVQRDALQVLGIRGWRSKAANRDEWRAEAPYMEGWNLLTRFANMELVGYMPSWDRSRIK